MSVIKLHDLKPARGSKTAKTRVGRGEGSKGKTAGRGTKGTGARKNVPVGFEGGQMPIHMRMRKLRGPHMKKSMPFEPFRTHTQPVNLKDLEERFDAGTEVTPELLAKANLAKRRGIPVKILAKGEISKALTVQAHGFSGKAREAIEAAGGTCVILEP
jgi:large subunit ribosomal protein L15